MHLALVLRRVIVTQHSLLVLLRCESLIIPRIAMSNGSVAFHLTDSHEFVLLLVRHDHLLRCMLHVTLVPRLHAIAPVLEANSRRVIV